MYQFSIIWGTSTGVAIWVEEHLGIAMDGNKSLNFAMALHKVDDSLDLWLRMSSTSSVGFSARV